MFGRKKKFEGKKETPKLVKELYYPPKIILAWAKALDGNTEIANWLLDNGYKELIMANHAIQLKDEARNWLMENGYPHLMAMINASEGNKGAQNWLITHGYTVLYHMAMAIDDEKDSWTWLGKNIPADMFLLTQTITKVKDKIEESHNDIHSFGKD